MITNDIEISHSESSANQCSSLSHLNTSNENRNVNKDNSISDHTLEESKVNETSHLNDTIESNLIEHPNPVDNEDKQTEDSNNQNNSSSSSNKDNSNLDDNISPEFAEKISHIMKSFMNERVNFDELVIRLSE